MTEKENALIAIKHGKPEWIPSFTGAYNRIFSTAVSERYGGKGEGKDAFGVSWTYEERIKSPSVTPGYKRIKDITKWHEQNIFPDLESVDWESAAKSDEQIFKVDRVNKLTVNCIGLGVFERFHSLLTFEDALCSFYEEPESAKELIYAIADYHIKLIEKFDQYYKPDIIFYMDDWGSAKGLFFSPNIFREFIRPAIQRVIDFVKSKGIIFELHSDGKVEELVPDMVQMGVDIWNPCQIVNNVRTLKDKFQDKLTFSCGFDNQGIMDRPDASEEEIRTAVRSGIDELAPGGSFMVNQVAYLGIGNAVEIVASETALYGFDFYKNKKQHVDKENL